MGKVVPANRQNLLEASRLLGAGALVCFPTETVYGVGGDASNPAAVRGIFEAKGRPASHPLIVHLPDAQWLDRWAAEIPDMARELAGRFWPGPLTLVLRRAADVPDEVTGGQATLALRVPSHPVARELLDLFGGGVAAPSANRFGRVSPTLARHAEQELGDRVAMVLDGGPCEVGVESSIIDLSGERPRLLRPGGVPRGMLEEVLGVNLLPVGAGPAGDAPPAPRVPGSLPGHYAPASPLFLVDGNDIEERLGSAGSAVTVLARRSRPRSSAMSEGSWHEMPLDAREYGRRLYSALRDADELGRPILVEAPPEEPEWEAIIDRLRRAGEQTATGEAGT